MHTPIFISSATNITIVMLDGDWFYKHSKLLFSITMLIFGGFILAVGLYSPFMYIYGLNVSIIVGIAVILIGVVYPLYLLKQAENRK
jgi:hypothetical protein